jgi:hypothetical protein
MTLKICFATAGSRQDGAMLWPGRFVDIDVTGAMGSAGFNPSAVQRQTR